MQIIVSVEGTPEDYLAARHHSKMLRPRNCPNCGRPGSMLALGYYERWVSSLKGQDLRLSIRRFRCEACGRTASLPPHFAQPYRLVRNDAIERYFSGNFARADVQRCSGLLACYWRRFTTWLPEFQRAIGDRFGRGPPDPAAEGRRVYPPSRSSWSKSLNGTPKNSARTFTWACQREYRFVLAKVSRDAAVFDLDEMNSPAPFSTSNPIPEFTDTYSDDLGYIIETYQLHVRQFGESRFSAASACRLYLIAAVGSVETLVKELHETKPHPDLAIYLTGDPKVTHEQRADALRRFIQEYRAPLVSDFLEDFFLIKKLRNIVIHGAWRAKNREQMQAGGFPSDTRELTAAHLGRAKQVYEHMLLVLGCCKSRHKPSTQPPLGA